MYALIIDDEKYARVSLRTLITEYCPEISKIQEASNVEEAVDTIKKTSPDIVFLDIEMPNISGLELPSFFEEEELDFHIIFVTAFSQYAVEAFRLSAVDYLLKPVDIDQLEEAMLKVQEKSKTNTAVISTLQENLEAQIIKRLVVPSSSGLEFIPVNQIRCLQADGSYTKINIYPNKDIVVSKSLKKFENLENYSHFFKCHRSHMININSIKRFYLTDSVIVLDDETKVPLSKRKKNLFIDLMNTINVNK